MKRIIFLRIRWPLCLIFSILLCANVFVVPFIALNRDLSSEIEKSTSEQNSTWSQAIGDCDSTCRIMSTCAPNHPKETIAKIQTDINQLLSLVKTDKQHSNSDHFMTERIRRMWPQWMDGLNRYRGWIDASSNQSTFKPNLYNRTCLHIHLHLGLLTLTPSIGIEEEINKGGPLGELVQWTDLITALYLLGHKVTVSKSITNTISVLQTWRSESARCKYIPQRPDLIYTDIRGYLQLRRPSITFPRCKFRVLDSFGTENKYNLRNPTSFSGLKLNLKQFQTFFPHTPDNSFLGFVIEKTSADLTTPRKPTGKPIALVAGKVIQMWQRAESYLEVLSEFFDIHGNVADVTDTNRLPSFVTNHQVISGTNYLGLLKSAKVLVGLGFPYESPSPLEAIAHGVIFLNVKFKIPHSKRTNPFFREKPTDRQLTSQHPYIEDYVGEPYSYLVDPEDPQQVRETVRRLLSKPPISGYVPFEFTSTGYLERLNALLNHQDFCPGSRGRHRKSFTPILAPASWSCNKACESVERLSSPGPSSSPTYSIQNGSQSTSVSDIHIARSSYLNQRYEYARPVRSWSVKWQRLQCDPQHFPDLNGAQKVSQLLNVTCLTETSSTELTAPFVDVGQGNCNFQSNDLAFSCTYPESSNQLDSNLRRICPCFARLIGQSTLCEECV